MKVRALKKRPIARVLAAVLCLAITLLNVDVPVLAQNGSVITTPPTPMEEPIEVEIELSPAGSLKQVPLWKELYQLLENPYDPVVRRPGFGVPMPALNIYPLDYNFLTAQLMRLRTSDGEVSWDQPGPLFDQAENVAPDQFSTPTLLRTPIGHLVACPNPGPDGAYQGAAVPGNFCTGKPDGSLVVYNPNAHPAIPPNGTVVAVAAYFDGVLHELEFDANGVWTGDYEELDELEAPVNEEHFFRDPADVAGVPGPLRPLIGRPAAEILGKALFWDMQVGSDGVQACGSCHFHGGVDNRTKGQLNSGTNAGDLASLEITAANTDVEAIDFPFHKRANPDISGDGAVLAISDSNDVMSSMGVSQFKLFNDIPTPGGGTGSAAFVQVAGPVKPLKPDLGTVASDPVPANQGFRRVEPRNTPTFHAAAFNLDNFWDGRARFNFNGGSVFGPSDPQFHIFVNNGTANGAMHGLPNPSEDTIDLPLHQWAPEPGEAAVPARIKFSSLASQAVGPPLSDFEMSFSGRNWQKIAKKLLQNGVTPLASQMVSPTDSVLGPYSNAPSRPGISLTYPQLIQLAFARQLWANNNQHFNGAPGPDPFDGYVLSAPVANAADPANTNQFNQMEANFSFFFGQAVQAYESLTIPDDTPMDRFFDINPNAGHGIGEPGDQAVLFPTLIPDLIDDGLLNNSGGAYINLVPDNPATPEYDGFTADEVFGFDLFAGGNLTAALNPSQSVGQSGRDRNPPHTILTENGNSIQIRVGSNPFTRSAKCMLCHLGPEQTDHSINISHGILKNDAEFEYPVPPQVPDPDEIFAPEADGPFAGMSMLPAPEPSGSSRAVAGLILSEEVSEGPPQDAVEVEPRNFATFDDPATPWDDRIISQQSNFAFGDQGIYNIGVRPIDEDIGRGGDDPFGWPLSLSALTLKNIGGEDFEPNDSQFENNIMANFDPNDLEATFEETGDGAFFPGTTYDLQSINPGFERGPINPQLPEYLAPWVNDLPAGELHPQIDEMAGMVPNTRTEPVGGPAIEFPEVMFGADQHCARYDPAVFGFGPPNFGWGPPISDDRLCPQHQSGVAGNFEFPVHGTWPVPNRVLRDGAFKAPPLRNVEISSPFFHTGSYLTLRQVVDFYFRGGDFPVTNAENRDPHVVDLFNSAFSLGRTTGDDLQAPINFDGVINSPTTPYFVSDVGFVDGLPDTVFRYDMYPDSDHPFTPEPTFASRVAAIEDAKQSLVKFLIALTDPRVKYERAPFDRPQIFVPIDGTAPANTGGPAVLAADARFLNVPAVGSAGHATPLPNFLNLTTIAPGRPGYNCSSSAGPVSHHCAVITP